MPVVQDMTVHENMLSGKALHTVSGQDHFVRHFPARQLPQDPAARFAHLFAAKSRWSLSELEPFLSGIQVSSDNN